MKNNLRKHIAMILTFAMIMSIIPAFGTYDVNAATRPRKVRSIKLKAKSKSIKVKWKKVRGAKGYQVRYCSKKSMVGAKKVKTTKLKKTISKLKAGTRYYVQVRAYKKKGKKRVYGKWSKKKSVVTKKVNSKANSDDKTPNIPGDTNEPTKPTDPVEPVEPEKPLHPEEVTFGGKNYELTFCDDFDFLDTSKWSYCPETKRQDAGCEWRNSCSSFVDGNYVITCSVDEDGTPISGGIRTRNKFSQKYGLYHTRFKMEKSSGLWYAFWLMSKEMGNSVGNGATDGAELDILEVVPNSNEFAMSVHWDGYGEDLKSYSKWKYIEDDFYDDYHELWYEWDEKGYRLYLDGMDEEHLMFDFDGKENTGGTCEVPTYIKITAEFGKWGGPINSDMKPAHFYVDYFEVYSQK